MCADVPFVCEVIVFVFVYVVVVVAFLPSWIEKVVLRKRR